MAAVRDNTAIALRGLTLGFGSGPEVKPVLVDVDLSVERGSFVAVVGPSGVGKSTLLRVIAGLHPPLAGTVSVSAGSSPKHRPVGMVFQDARLLPWRRVLRNVELGLEGLPVDRREREERARAALRLVRLEGYERRWPYELSGGQRQRVGIARALAVDPDILLMDEPFGALDAITRRGLQDELRRIHGETGKTVIFVTHDIDEAVHLADRILLLGGSPARISREVRQGADAARRGDGDAFHAQVKSIEAGIADSYSI